MANPPHDFGSDGLVHESRGRTVLVLAAFAVAALVFAAGVALTHGVTMRTLQSPEGEEISVVSRSLLLQRRLEMVSPRDTLFVFAGTSMMREAMDPRIAYEAIPIRPTIVNLGIPARHPCRALPEQTALRAADPELVVIGISYLDFRDENCTLTQPLLDGAVGGELPSELRGLLPDADERELQRGHRMPFFATQPWATPVVVAAFERWRAGEPVAVPPIDDAYVTERFTTTWRYDGRPIEAAEALRRRWRSAPENFAPVSEDSPGAEALRRIVRGLQDAGATVVLVVMPMHPEVTATELSPEAYASLRQTAASVAATLDVTLFDYETRYATEHFYDITHLNSSGRALFSADLTAELLASREVQAVISATTASMPEAASGARE